MPFALYTKRRGWAVAGEYVDTGISGTKERRPELDRLMADAHKRRFDVVVVWRFDRFARSVSHLLRALETFQALGIEFVSLSEQMDTSTPSGKMIFTVLGAVAELERSLIAERVRAGMRNARAKGARIGRPPRTILSLEDRKAIAEAYWRGKCSFRELAKKFDTRLGPSSGVRRCIKRGFSALPQVADSSSRLNPFCCRIKPFLLVQPVANSSLLSSGDMR
jgi:DNA invertase Pin-like site-specific DNA recombinase